MRYKTHLALGILIGILYIYFFRNVNIYLFMPVVALFSIMPDLDTPNSFISHKLPFLSFPISLISKHRGFFHSVFPPLILFFIFYQFNYPTLAFGIFIGYIAHLIGDALTVEGINFLHPFSRFTIQGPIETGSFGEILFL